MSFDGNTDANQLPLLGEEESSQYLGEKFGIEFPASLLRLLQEAGIGPHGGKFPPKNPWWSVKYYQTDLDLFADFVMGKSRPAAYWDKIEVLGNGSGRPRWLLIADNGPLYDSIRDLLFAWGANVMGPVGNIRHAMAVANTGRFDAALLFVDGNIPAGLIVAYQLLWQGTPVAFVTTRTDLPDAFGRMGMIINGIDYMWIGRGLEMGMPQRVVSRMTLNTKVRASDCQRHEPLRCPLDAVLEYLAETSQAEIS